MTVLEPGPGMGFFSLEIARRIGASGKLIAVDVQQKMLDSLRRRAQRKNVSDRIECSLKTHRLWRWSCADGYAFRHNKGSDA